jgi:formylglycine-generating enzyme required for sulfatase activity
MPPRATLALLLLLASTAPTQELDTAVSAVVRIAGMRGGTPVRGSGFVVGLDRDRATIITAAHVIEGVQHPEVTFGVDPTESLPADVVLGMDAGNPNGLAVFQVRGALPAGVTTLSFELRSRPRLGEALFLLGFPQMELEPRATQRVLSARRGTLLLVDQQIGEGFSGGPVIQGGKVVGVVTDMDGQTTYAVNAVVAHEALEGWGVKLGGQSGSTRGPSTAIRTKPAAPALEGLGVGGQSSTAVPRTAAPPTLSPAALNACVPGEERTEAGIVFVRICGGTFTMGSADDNGPLVDKDEKPAHQVSVSEFWIARTVTTNEQYRRFRPDHKGAAKLPVTNVSWTEAKAACERFGGRLPTEAEWEYAARAGSHATWPFGDDEKRVGEYAWYNGNSEGRPHPVDTKKPNAWGLYDMYGSVWQWVADWYGPYTVAQTDPTGPPTGKERVLRGSYFNDYWPNQRPAFRGRREPSYRYWYIGFRCAQGPSRQP